MTTERILGWRNRYASITPSNVEGKARMQVNTFGPESRHVSFDLDVQKATYLVEILKDYIKDNGGKI